MHAPGYLNDMKNHPHEFTKTPFFRAYALAYLNKDQTQTKKLIKTDTSHSFTIRAESIAKIVDAMLSSKIAEAKSASRTLADC